MRPYFLWPSILYFNFHSAWTPMMGEPAGLRGIRRICQDSKDQGSKDHQGTRDGRKPQYYSGRFHPIQSVPCFPSTSRTIPAANIKIKRKNNKKQSAFWLNVQEDQQRLRLLLSKTNKSRHPLAHPVGNAETGPWPLSGGQGDTLPTAASSNHVYCV